jgi:hypothetical protein
MSIRRLGNNKTAIISHEYKDCLSAPNISCTSRAPQHMGPERVIFNRVRTCEVESNSRTFQGHVSVNSRTKCTEEKGLESVKSDVELFKTF